jgi:hypothetical protein
VTRFVIVGHGRSGSSLLQVALDRHPAVRCRGELFHNDPQHRERARGEVYRDAAPVESFLREAAFSARDGVAAVGFKLFFYHARQAGASALWDHLAADRELRVILLQRRNLFDSLVSHERSRRARQWRLAPGEALADDYLQPVRLDPEWCERFFEQTLAGMEMTRRRFCRHPLLALDYEELVAGFGETLARCQRHLGVDPLAVEPPLLRMNGVPHERGVENYAALQRHFAGSLFAPFFTKEGGC